MNKLLMMQLLCQSNCGYNPEYENLSEEEKNYLDYIEKCLYESDEKFSNACLKSMFLILEVFSKIGTDEELAEKLTDRSEITAIEKSTHFFIASFEAPSFAHTGVAIAKAFLLAEGLHLLALPQEPIGNAGKLCVAVIRLKLAVLLECPALAALGAEYLRALRGHF